MFNNIKQTIITHNDDGTASVKREGAGSTTGRED